jgi:exodeoxyribonuclease V alpha subunit
VDLFERAAGKNAPGGSDETLEGTVERIVFAGGDGTFTVARLKVEKGGAVVTVVGALMGVPQGASLRVRGRYETTARFGEQFRVAQFTEVAPATLDGIRRYLGSGLIKGIGPEFAGRIVDRFGIQTLEILDSDPSRISEVSGIGPSRAKSIRAAWSAQREVRKVMVFLQGYGVSPAFAARIYKRYGERSIALVRENPYRLAFDVWGIGFLSADKLAGALGIGKESEVRVEAGVRHVIQDSSTNGDVFVPRERLVRQAAALLEVTEKMADEAVDRLARLGDVAIDASVNVGALDAGAAIYDADLYRAERAVAVGLQKLLAGNAEVVDVDVPRALAWYEQ